MSQVYLNSMESSEEILYIKFCLIQSVYKCVFSSFCFRAASSVHTMNQGPSFEDRFEEVTNQCYQELERIEIKSEQVRVVVTDTLFPSETGREEGHRDNLFADDEDVDDIFRTLTQYGVWDFQNYLLLKAIITHFASESAHVFEVLSKYEVDLTQYQKKTVTLDIRNLEDKEVSVSGVFQVLNVELSRSAADMCLHQVTDLSKSFSNHFNLVPMALLLKKVTKDPLTIMWLIPTIFCNKISDLISLNQEWLEEKNIVYMALESKVLYKRDNENVSIFVGIPHRHME